MPAPTPPPAPTRRPRVVLDCDPGLDDAVAIALALDHTDVVAITTVGGNVGVAATTHNALAVTELVGRADVEVHAGHDEPIDAAPIQRAADVHGPNGMGDTALPEPTRPPTSTDAVGALLTASHEYDDLWIVATGPLTNIAHAIRRDPTIVDRVRGLSWMGGSSTYGNVTAAAEFNAWADPEAMAVVFGAGFERVLMHGLNVTHTVLLDDAWIDRLAAVDGAVAATFAGVLRFYRRRQIELSTLPGAAVHDALAVLHVSHPQLFSPVPRHVSAVVDGSARGMTLVDRRPEASPPPPNVEVIEAADADALRAVMWSTLARTY